MYILIHNTTINSKSVIIYYVASAQRPDPSRARAEGDAWNLSCILVYYIMYEFYTCVYIYIYIYMYIYI